MEEINMAIRPVFIVNKKNISYVKEINIDFKWYPGFSKKQKRKSISSLHSNFLSETKYKDDKILEISTKSENMLGVQLSAFNLELKMSDQKAPVECFFQSSKVFEEGGPYKELLYKSPYEVKKDNRLRNSGSLVSFELNNENWPLKPKTLFYDWLYMNALHQNKKLIKQVMKFEAFTDIEFNPKKSINCQARSLALYLSLKSRGIVEDIIRDKDEFIEFFKKDKGKKQMQLFN